MTAPVRVDPTKPAPKVLTGDEWESAQSAPASVWQSADPSKATIPATSRPLTGDEWEHANRMTPAQVQSWKIPALPKPTIARDVTQTPANSDRGQGDKIGGLAGVLTRQLVDPVLEHPFVSAGMAAAPFALPGLAGLAAGAGIAGASVYHIAQYGWQKLAESQLDPETRKLAEADPERISGESAAVQAAMLGLAPLIHVGLNAGDVSAGVLDAGAKGAASEIRAGTPRFSRGAIEGQQRSDFAAALEQGAQNQGTGEGPALKGLQTTPDFSPPSRVKPVEGLVVPETVRSGRVKPIETQPVDAALVERANIDQARRDYEASRIEQDTADLAAQRTADAERLLGLSDQPQDLTVRRRPGGVKQTAPTFETPQGAEILGATAARHGLPEESNPYHPSLPLAADWQAGHQAATETYQSFPEGFTMGGAESRIPADYTPPRVQGFEPTQIPEGATPETVQLANALKPSRFRGKTEDQLVQAAQQANATIADETAPDKAITRAKSALAQVEREFALRGVTGDQIAQKIGGGDVPRETSVVPSLAPIEGTGEVRTRGLALGVQAKAIANRLDAEFPDLPTYKRMRFAEQGDQAAALLNGNPELARAVAMGEQPAPTNLSPRAVFIAVENKAITEGDVATLRDLSQSKLVEETTRAAQELGILRTRNSDSPVEAMQEVIDARTRGKDVTKVTERELNTIAQHVKPIESKTFLDFLDDMAC